MMPTALPELGPAPPLGPDAGWRTPTWDNTPIYLFEWIMFAHFEEMARISRGAGISVRT